jgi:hypothetical protein
MSAAGAHIVRINFDFQALVPQGGTLSGRLE